MRKELEIISDIVGSNNKVVKQNVIYKKVFELDNILVENFISNKGLIIKKYCTVVEDNKFYKVNSPYEYVANLIKPIEVKGFYSKSSKYEKDKTVQSRKNKLG